MNFQKTTQLSLQDTDISPVTNTTQIPSYLKDEKWQATVLLNFVWYLRCHRSVKPVWKKFPATFTRAQQGSSPLQMETCKQSLLVPTLAFFEKLQHITRQQDGESHQEAQTQPPN